MAGQRLFDFFCPSIVDFIEPNAEEVEADFDELLRNLDSDIQLDGPDVVPVLDPSALATPLNIDTPTCARPIQTATSSTHTFAVATGSDLQRFRDKNKNRNTMKTTVTWVNRFETWRKVREIPHKLEHIPERELDNVLQRFFAELRKGDGGEYEPESLRTMLASLDRFLREEGRPYSILKDKEFEGCRKVLNGKAIELRENGMGKRKNRSDPLSEQEEEQLWQRRVLGGCNPKSLNHTVFFLISQQFGTRGCQEHHQLRLEDLKFVCDPTGKTISVEWVEGLTKTRQGGLSKIERRLPQKMFAQGGDHCPVKFMELLISKRPQKLRKTGPLYLRPLEQPREDVWYSSQPVGVRTIDTYMKEMAKLGKLDSTNKKFTNHSIRKTTVRKLQKAGISNDRIAAITGHRNEQSLRDYADADPDDHRAISAILSNPYPLQTRTNSNSLPYQCLPTKPKLPVVVPSTSFAASTVPQYNFMNCTVYFGGSSMSCTQVNPHTTTPPPRKKCRVIIDSDSDED